MDVHHAEIGSGHHFNLESKEIAASEEQRRFDESIIKPRCETY